MPRRIAVLVALAVSTSACLPAHAPTARRVGMVASIAGVLGLMATAAVQSYARTDELLGAFSLLSGGGILVFAAGELSIPPRGPAPETETEKHRRWARILTERAAGAAREGRCPRVRRLEKRVNVYDREVHDFVFMRDPKILDCLGAVAPASEAERAVDPAAPAPEPSDPDEPPRLRLPPGTVIPPTP